MPAKAYLAWPLKLKGINHEFHVTLKYLGTSPFSVEGLTDRFVDERTVLDLSRATWTFEKFNPQTHVMVLEGLDKRLLQTRQVVEDLREEDFPTWRPHITLPKELWKQMADAGILLKSPQEVIEHVGPLTLYVNKAPTVNW